MRLAKKWRGTAQRVVRPAAAAALAQALNSPPEVWWIHAESTHHGLGLCHRAQRVDNDGKKGVAVGILAALPRQLRLDVGGRKKAVIVHADVEGMRVVPEQDGGTEKACIQW